MPVLTKSAPTRNPRRIEQARAELMLRMRIDDDAEFPDIASRVARKFNVDYDLLREAYDRECK